MNGIEGKNWLEKRSFCGRNNQIIQKVLKKTKEKLNELIKESIFARNFEVFDYLIQEFNVKEFLFNEGVSRKFVEKIEFPLFDFNEFYSIYFDWVTEYIEIILIPSSL